MRSRELTIPGVELDGGLRGIDYLLNINLGYKVEMGQHVVVIGGGNVALDVARTAARGGEQANLQRNLSIVAALDVARSAIRFGARKVTVCSLESESEMPAAREEMEEAEKEGIRFLHRVGPKRLVGETGTVTGIEFLQVSRVFDETGRFSPQFIEGSETIFPTDTVIISIGQTGDFSFLRPEDKIETRGGRIVIDPDTLATTAPGIWAGGDAAFGPRIAINAIADGKKGARSIDEHFRGFIAISPFLLIATAGPASLPAQYDRARWPELKAIFADEGTDPLGGAVWTRRSGTPVIAIASQARAAARSVVAGPAHPAAASPPRKLPDRACGTRGLRALRATPSAAEETRDRGP